MDEITKGWLMELAKLYPGYAITLSHQFLDGIDLHPCGFVPHDWNGQSVFYWIR